MRKVALLAAVFGLCLFASGAFAQNVTNTTWKDELRQDKKDIREEKKELKSDTLEAKGEESALRQQIQEAKKAGDVEKVKNLREKLHAMHHENVGQRNEDKKELHQAHQEFKHDLKQHKK